MPEVTVRLNKASAKELTDVDVQYVSIVKRGANRIPIRITKSEDEMAGLNLHNLFRKADPLPGVVAVAVSKGADIDIAKARIEKAGLNANDPREHENGATLFVQPGENMEQDDLEVIKYDEQIALILKNAGLKKTFSDFNFESTEFKEVMGQEGFFPSLSAAHGVLGATISNIMQKSDDAGTAKEQISKAISDFGKFVDGLVGSIPVSAFKFEADEDPPAPVKKTDDKKPVDKADGGDGDGGSDGGDDGNVNKDDDDDDDPDKKAAHGKGKDKSKKADGDNKPADNGDSNTPDNSAQLGQIIEGMGSLKETVGSIAKAVEGQGTKLDEVAKTAQAAMDTAKKADEAVTGIIPADAPDDKENVQKGNRRSDPRLLDTARMTKKEKQDEGILADNTVRR